MKRIKVGVVGVGAMGRNHARTYASHPGAELVGVADIDPGVALAAGTEFSVPHFADCRTLVEEAGPEAVSICTSDEMHVDPTLTAFSAARHVLLEKPIATSLEDADSLIEAAQSVGVCFLVGHLLRFEPRYELAMRTVDGGEIGDLISIFARRLNHLATQDRIKGRVSVLSFLGVHDFDICHRLVGSRARRVYCEAHRGLLSARGYDVEDNTFTTVRFENGAIACVEAGWALPDNHPRQADFSLEVIGSEGVINLDLMSSGVAVCGRNGYRYPPLGNALERQIDHFIRCIRGEEKPAVTGAEARHALEISLAAQTSAQTGEPVELPAG